MTAGSVDDDETFTAYHESGHAYMGFALGGDVESVQLGGEADDYLPERFGECRMNWGPVDADQDWHLRREILTILAGPVAEMIYRQEPLHPAHYGPWQHDWAEAFERARAFWPDRERCTGELEKIIRKLYAIVAADNVWPAIAALADELSAHETLDSDQIEQTLAFWMRHSGTQVRL